MLTFSPSKGAAGGVGEGLLDEVGDPVGETVGEPDTTKRPPVLIAAAGGTDGDCNVTGRV